MARHAKAPIPREDIAPAPPRERWSPSAETQGAVESPARRLQVDLETAILAREDKWSPRQTTLFLLVTNSLFWAGLVWGVRALV